MEPLKHVADASAALAAFTAILNVLPVVISCVAGALSIAWYIVRFIDRQRAINKGSSVTE